MKKPLLIILFLFLLTGCTPSNNKSNVVEINNNTEAVYQEMNRATALPHHFMKCIPQERYICGDEGCEAAEPSVFTLLSGRKSEGKLIRCDAKGCDEYEAVAQDSGIYENIQTISPRGFFLKRQTMFAEIEVLTQQPYVEVTTMGTTININRGICSDK